MEEEGKLKDLEGKPKDREGMPKDREGKQLREEEDTQMAAEDKLKLVGMPIAAGSIVLVGT